MSRRAHRRTDDDDDDLGRDIVQQLQLLIQEPMESLQLDSGRTDVGSNGSVSGDTADTNDSGSFQMASGVTTPTATVSTTIDTSSGGHTWDFLANAAQIFERTSEEVAAADIRKGFDVQGYQWRGYEIQKQLYMTYRRQVYPQYQGVAHDVQAVRKQASCVDNTASFYSFRGSLLGDKYRGQINHFQLRDLICATSSYDVYYHHADGVYCWNPWLQSRRCVVSRSQMAKASSSFRVSSLSADRGIVFVGDYRGQYCVKSLWSDDDDPVVVVDGGRSVLGNDIVNHATTGVSRSGRVQVLAAHNSGSLRQLDVERLEVVDSMAFEWAVNCSATTWDGSLDCVAGDSIDSLLVDQRLASSGGAVVARLTGHRDFSFACAFSPDARLVATGSQDSTARVYDVRWPQMPLATLCGYMGAMRVVKFSAD
ncbi:hypothetical protein IWW38_005155, partial [Coemansia aciculifera]